VPASRRPATLSSASRGQRLYQSMVVQLMSDGNWRHLQGRMKQGRQAAS
jgi:hypothetical protein